MGGGYYESDAHEERQVYSSAAAPAASGGYAFSQEAAQVLAQTEIHSDCDPYGRQLICRNKSPIIVALDVTGSMGNWSKIIYDKLPMLFGQLMLQNYLDDPAICFAAVGDANSDQAPLQVCEFAQGAALDDWVSKLWLEGGGGGQNHETYELAGYFFQNKIIYDGCEGKPFLFFTGDEGFYPVVLEEYITAYVDSNDAGCGNVPAETLFKELRRKYHVFLLHRPFFDPELDRQLRAKWESVIGGEHIFELDDPKAVVDVILGAVALVSGSRNLDKYMMDLSDRGQTDDRKTKVAAALSGLVAELAGDTPAPGEAQAPAPTAVPAAAPSTSNSEMEAMRAELEAAKLEIQKMKMAKELAEARAEIARLKAGK